MKCKLCDYEFKPGDGKLEHFLTMHLGLMWKFKETRDLASIVDGYFVEDLQK